MGWFVALAALQLGLAGGLAYYSIVGLSHTTFGFGPTAAILISCLVSAVAQVSTAVVAASAPRRLDYDVILCISGGQLLSYVQVAAMCANDASVFNGFVAQTVKQLNVSNVPPTCNATEPPCNWDYVTHAIEQANGVQESQTGSIMSYALFCMIAQMLIIVVAAYQRCGLTASDDTYSK
jgi:hypothetical protein